jgi:hypothetical protein
VAVKLGLGAGAGVTIEPRAGAAGVLKYSADDWADVLDPLKCVNAHRYWWLFTRYPLGSVNELPVSRVVVVPPALGYTSTSSVRSRMYKP